MLGNECVRKAEAEGNWKRGPFILTSSGEVFSFDHINPKSIEIGDIAHSLSQLCRYTGHTPTFYSVAQHSLLVSEKMPGGPPEKLVGLLHDAAEAYVNDLASPLKTWLESQGNLEYGRLHRTILATIYDKFGITNIPSDVSLYDRAAGLFEAGGFLGYSVEALQQFGFPTELWGLWQPWDPEGFAGTSCDREFGEVETEFLRRFEALMHACGRGEMV